MTMEPNDCSTFYRFQFASIAFLCGVYLPFTFHSTVWSLYTQPFTPVNCTGIKTPFLLESISNITKNYNRSECCLCNGVLSRTITDKRLLALCQEWIANMNGLNIRKATIIDEWHLTCREENRKNLMIGSTSFLIAEVLGVITIGILADQYGRKLMLLMCLYIPVLFGSLAAFTTTYSLFIILRCPVGFFNKGLLLLGFIMVIESCEYKHRAQIGSLLLACIPVFGIIIGVTYFFLLDWRHMQLLGTLITTLTLCYPWLIPESRRWYVDSHRVSRVNKLLQLCSNKQPSTLGLNKVGSSSGTTIYDKPILSQETLHAQTGSVSCLVINQQLRSITCCLFILWFVYYLKANISYFVNQRFLSSFCYRCTFFPAIFPHPTMNYVLMNAIEFFSFIIALLVAYKIGRRTPLAVLTLISGLSSVSLAVTLLGTGHTWLEITFSLLARGCLRICYCLLLLFTAELYPTSVRGTGLAIGLGSEGISRILVEVLLYFSIDRTLLLFISGGILCLSCCLIFPLPETILYDLPDSLTDLQSMKRSTRNETNDDILPHNSHYHAIDSNTFTFPRASQSNTTVTTNDLNDLSALNPQTIFRTQQQQQGEGRGKNLTTHSQPELFQLHSNTSSLNGLSNPCYFASLNDTIDQYDIDQQQDNRVVISFRGVQHSINNNNNNNNSEDTKF